MNSRGSTAIQNFKFPWTGGTCRIFIDEDGNTWWVAVDVCLLLGLGNSRQALSRLDDDEKMAVVINDTSSNGVSQRRRVSVVNESGLYALIFSSRKPEAKEFKRWVTHEVLPSIRKTGAYGHLSYKEFDPTDPIQIRKLLDVLNAQALKDQEAIQALKW